MKVKFNSKELELLKDILVDTKYYEWVSKIDSYEEVEVVDADEIREIFEDVEIEEALIAERMKSRMSDKGNVASDIVDKLFE